MEDDKRILPIELLASAIIILLKEEATLFQYKPIFEEERPTREWTFTWEKFHTFYMVVISRFSLIFWVLSQYDVFLNVFSESEEAYHLQNGPLEKIWGREMNVKKWYWNLDGVF